MEVNEIRHGSQSDEIEKIVDHRYISGILEYRVRWQGSPADGTEDEWFTAKALRNRQPGLTHAQQESRSSAVQKILEDYRSIHNGIFSEEKEREKESDEADDIADEAHVQVSNFLNSLGLSDAPKIPRLNFMKKLMEKSNYNNENYEDQNSVFSQLLKPTQWAAIFQALDSQKAGYITRKSLIEMCRNEILMREDEDVDNTDMLTKGSNDSLHNGLEKDEETSIKGDVPKKIGHGESTATGKVTVENEDKIDRKPTLLSNTVSAEEAILYKKYPEFAKVWQGILVRKQNTEITYKDILNELQLNFEFLETLEVAGKQIPHQESLRQAVFTKLFKAMDVRLEQKNEGKLQDESILFSDFLALMPSVLLEKSDTTSSSNYAANEDSFSNKDEDDVDEKEEEIIENEISRRIRKSGLSRMIHFNYMQLHRFPRALLSLKDLTDLSLKGNFIKQLPSEICHLRSLSRFCCSHNQLEALPLTIGLLAPTLQLLDVSNNKLTILPKELSRLHKLVHLDISDNKIYTIPTSLGSGCLQLEKLLCFGNPLDPEILEKLQEGLPVLLTYLQACFLIEEEQKQKIREEVAVQRKTSEFGAAITDPSLEIENMPLDHDAHLLANYRMVEFLPKTQRLVVDSRLNTSSSHSSHGAGTVVMENMGLRELPGKLFTEKSSRGNSTKELGPTSIFSLNISRNFRLQAISEKISKLKNLVYLDASHCAIRELPESMTELTSLRTLNIAQNKLQSIPKCIASLEKLEVLDLSDNKITQITYFLSNLTCLHSISLHGNELESDKDSRASLQILRDEGITAFQVFLVLSHEKELGVDVVMNQLKKLRSSSSKLELAESTKVLNLSQSAMRVVPDGVFSRIPDVIDIDLSDNLLSWLPPEISRLSDLQRLSAANNMIRTQGIPSTFNRLTSLLSLSLANNVLDNIPYAVCCLTSLQMLDVSWNRLVSLPDHFVNLKNLKSLFIDGNEGMEPEIIAANTKSTQHVLLYLRERRKARYGKRFSEISKSATSKDIEISPRFLA
eukprot:g149.t1